MKKQSVQWYSIAVVTAKIVILFYYVADSVCNFVYNDDDDDDDDDNDSDNNNNNNNNNKQQLLLQLLLLLLLVVTTTVKLSCMLSLYVCRRSGEPVIQERILDQQSSSAQTPRGLWVAERSRVSRSWRRRRSDITSMYCTRQLLRRTTDPQDWPRQKNACHWNHHCHVAGQRTGSV